MKRLVACLDGTWNRMNVEDETNVAKTCKAILRVAPDGTRQEVFYDEGVGAQGGLVDRLIDGATGRGLSKNVRDAYGFLVDHYEPGDEVFLFGFSRGAYTARSTVGLVRKCGLLHKEKKDLVPEAYALYREPGEVDGPRATDFRAKNSREVPIRFLGVWDTVGALGVPGVFRSLTARRHQFHNVEPSRIVRAAYHAVSIDERRRAYQPTLWKTKAMEGQILEQAWFAGAHSDVGGGYVPAGLSDVAFEWMRQNAERAGLAFDPAFVKERVRPDPASTLHDSTKPLWWLLGTRERVLGDPEHLPQEVHGSVLARRADPKLGYRPANLERFLQANPSGQKRA